MCIRDRRPTGRRGRRQQCGEPRCPATAGPRRLTPPRGAGRPRGTDAAEVAPPRGHTAAARRRGATA
eukprot:10840902-Alexandrium_andersonii.AAC.1